MAIKGTLCAQTAMFALAIGAMPHAAQAADAAPPAAAAPVAATEPGEIVVKYGVTIIGTKNIPSTLPYHSSQLYSRNVLTLLQHLIKDGAPNFDWNDEITKGTTLTHDGTIIHPPTLAALSAKGAN